jgi:hypothetical protein
MRQAGCPREADVLKAIRTRIQEEALSDHLAECAVCKEVVQASRWMRDLATDCEETRPLPDASLLWRRAQLSQLQAKAEKAQEFLEWRDIISAIVISAAVAGWIGWNWSAIQTQLASFLADAWAQTWITASSVVSTTAIVFSFGTVIVSVVAAVLVYPLVVQD